MEFPPLSNRKDVSVDEPGAGPPKRPSGPAILCRGLSKRYQSRKQSVDALQGIDLTVERAQCFGLLGPNGAGKTTTVEILEGLLEPSSGTVEILGRTWGSGFDQSLRQRIGMTLQETRFQEKLSVIEILRLFRSFYDRGITPEEAIELVGLEEKTHSWVRELSGGQRQRLAVSSALVGKPELLFLDEPTTGLDPQARRKLWEVVESLRRQGRTIVLTTHYMDEAERLCDRVAVIDHGKVIAEGSPRDLIANLGGHHVIEFSLEENSAEPVDAAVFLSVDSVSRASRETESYLLSVEHPHLSLPSLLETLRSQELTLSSLTTRHANLEDVFVSLTGRHLRDG